MSAFILAEEQVECIEFNGNEYCTVVTVINVGPVQVPVQNPLDLLDAAEKAQVKKLSLWEDYQVPPVIEELAKQVGMTPDELIFVLRDADAAWGGLYELTERYGDLRSNLFREHVSESDIDRLFRHIIFDISQDIKDQLKHYKVVEV